MTTSQEKLARRLPYLPLDLHEKVLLWLAYRGLKPVSEITVERRNMALLRKGIRTSPPNIKNKINRIRKWIHDAGLFYATEPGYASSWHVGRNRDQVKLSAKILRRFDYENEYRSGTLFGFPKESAKAYARNRVLKLGENRIQMIRPFHSFLKDKYYTPYLFYSMRADRVKQDSQTAQLWANTIREEVPILAKWHEKYQAKQRNREMRLNDRKGISRRNGQSDKQTVAEYLSRKSSLRTVLIKALSDFFVGQIDDFQLASICFELKTHLTKAERENRDLITILKQGGKIYQSGGRLKINAKSEAIKKLLAWYKAKNG